MEQSAGVINKSYFLYADDDQDDQAIITEMLRKVDDSISLLCMNNGLELYEYLDALKPGEQLPSCIILDMNMPIWNGLRALKAIKEDQTYRDIPTFIFSTSTNIADAEHSISLGADGFVTKPYGQKELYSVCEDFADYTVKPPRYKIKSVSGNSVHS